MARHSDTAATHLSAAARRLRDAEHVAAVVGGRAAYAELAAARAAMSTATGIKHRHHPAPLAQEPEGPTDMATIANCVRISTKRSAVWRECATCGALAPLAPDEIRCPPCREPAREARPAQRRRLAA